MKPHYLKHGDIDEVKWDACVEKASNGLVFSNTWFLNGIAGEKWDALVLGDYEAVMPLIWKRKLGIKILVQPYFIQQSGVTGNLLNEEVTDTFLKAIPKHFRLVNISLNIGNRLKLINGMNLIQRSNYLLNLDNSYDKLAEGFSSDTRKTLRQAERKGLEMTEEIQLSEIFDFYEQSYGQFNKHVPESYFKSFKGVVEQAMLKGNAKLYGILDRELNMLGGGVFFVNSRFITYSFAAPSADGRKHDAMHILLAKVIRLYSETKLKLDFEGSDIPSVAYFYSKFGSEKQHYFQLKWNRLPFPLNKIRF